MKDVVRTGWKDWNVSRGRLESVAEHIFGVQMLAVVMNSEYQYNVDIFKVIMMLAVHELEEIYIGDLTLFQISKEEKDLLGHEAVEKVLHGLLDKDRIKSLIIEFDKRETPEAKFAYYCDKLECDLQCKLYDEESCVDLNKQEENSACENELVKKLLSANMSWSEMWLTFGKHRYNYDENFKEVSDCAQTHSLKNLIK